MSPFRFENKEGQPVKVGGHLVTPISQNLQITVPGFSGGLVWNRPLAVRVQTADGQQQRIPVPDVTRLVLLAIMGFSLLLALIAVSRK
ncbi:MAG: hypothetical protein ACOYYS_03200 [Chloroflexota bacterium]